MSKDIEAPGASWVLVPAPPLFGMPQAFVIIGFLAATVILRVITDMDIRDIVILVGSAGSIGVAVVVAASFRRGGGRLVLNLAKALGLASKALKSLSGS